MLECCNAITADDKGYVLLLKEARLQARFDDVEWARHDRAAHTTEPVRYEYTFRERKSENVPPGSKVLP